jgi:hypothetical protein
LCSEGRDDPNRLDSVIAEIAGQSGAVLHAYPRAGKTVRWMVLRDARHDQDTQSEGAGRGAAGTHGGGGRDTGPKVSAFFGAGITCYEWVYVLAPGQVSHLRTVLGAPNGQDVLACLRAYYDQHQGRIHALLTSAQVAASFSTWHS